MIQSGTNLNDFIQLHLANTKYSDTKALVNDIREKNEEAIQIAEKLSDHIRGMTI